MIRLKTIVNIAVIFWAVAFFTPLLNHSIEPSTLKSIVVGLFAGGCIFTVGKLVMFEKKLPIWLGIIILAAIPAITYLIFKNNG